jgi:hypothetical protein
MSKKPSINWMVFLLGISFLIGVTGCASTKSTKGSEFPLMYEESPNTILILPPINQSTAADAKEYYATTIQEILSYWGYYTFPYEVTADIFKMERIYDAELIKDVPLGKFREFFGADAVLFTTIKKWDMSYMVLAASLTVSIDAELISTISDQTLWDYNGTVVVDLSGGSGGGGGLAGLIAQAIVTSAQAAMADYVPHAKTANYRALSSLPFGKYHPQYMTDQSVQIVDQTPAGVIE